jgi:hypothetical protein
VAEQGFESSIDQCRRFFSCEAHKADTRDASILPMLLLRPSAASFWLGCLSE